MNIMEMGSDGSILNRFMTPGLPTAGIATIADNFGRLLITGAVNTGSSQAYFLRCWPSRGDRGYTLQGVTCYSDDIYGVYLFVVYIYVLAHADS